MFPHQKETKKSLLELEKVFITLRSIVIMIIIILSTNGCKIKKATINPNNNDDNCFQ